MSYVTPELTASRISKPASMAWTGAEIASISMPGAVGYITPDNTQSRI